MRVTQWMKKDPITIGPETGVWEAARLMHDRKIGCLPVLEGEAQVSPPPR